MIGSILSAVSGLFSIISTALGWAKEKNDQNIGAQLQAAKDDQLTIQEAVNAQKVDEVVGTESRDALVRELSGPASGAS